MKRENLKKADFAEYNKLGCNTRAVARVKGEECLVIVDNPDRGVYNVLADNVKEIKEISEYLTMVYETADGRFGFVKKNGVNVIVNGTEDLRCAGHLSQEFFIVKKAAGEYVLEILADGSARRYAGPFKSIRPFDKHGIMVVREMQNGEHSAIALNTRFDRVSGWFKEIGEANDQGVRVATFGNNGYLLNKDFRTANEFVKKVFFERGEDGVIKAPTAMMPVKDQRGMVGFVDTSEDGSPFVSNLLTGDTISAPSKTGVVEITRGIGKQKSVEHISVIKADDDNYLIDRTVNTVEDVSFFDAVLGSLNKSSGESIFKMDRKYFADKHTLSDIKVAYRKFFDERIDKMKGIILSGREYDDLRTDQVEYLEFLLDGFKEEMTRNFHSCLRAKTAEVEVEGADGHVLEDLTIDEILYDPLEEIYDEIQSGR